MCSTSLNDLSNKSQQGFLGGTKEKRFLRSLIIPGADIQGVMELDRNMSGDYTNVKDEKRKNLHQVSIDGTDEQMMRRY